MLTPLAANLIRTYVPILVGAAASWLAARGIQVPAQDTALAVASMTAVFSGAYYTIVRVLEERFPQLGSWLLLSHPAGPAAPSEPGDPWQGYPPADETSWPPKDEGSTLLRHPDGSPTSGAPATMPPPGPDLSTAVLLKLDELISGAREQPGQQVARASSVSMSHLAAPLPQPPPTRPDPVQVRKADTGAIPVYRRPAGR